MLRIISERTLNTDESLCGCFIDWQKAFDRINWIKLMQIVKETGIDWRGRRLTSKLYVDQSVNVRLDQVDLMSVKTGKGVRQGCCLSLIILIYRATTLPGMLLNVLETSKEG